MKPIIRWNIGIHSALAIEALKYSVRSIRKLYGKEFHLVIAYNNLNEEELHSIQVDEFINQSNFIKEHFIPPNNSCEWKLYPSRTNLQSHEIMIDNDLVIYKRMAQIEKFINSDCLFLATQALRRNYSLLDSLIKQDFNICSGFIGIPPKFDYKTELNQVIEKLNSWNGFFDEQSVVAYVLQSKNVEIIPLKEINIIGRYSEYKLGTHGTHFTGLNRGWNFYWERFTTIKLI